MNFLRALIASLFPRKYRAAWRSQSFPNLLLAAFLSGVLEFTVFGYFEFLQFRKHFVALADYFSQGNETTQAAALLLLAVSELFYPLSLLLILLAAEGFLRAVAAAIPGEVLPSVFVAFPVWLWSRWRRPHPG